jgi:hypothetical protein
MAETVWAATCARPRLKVHRRMPGRASFFTPQTAAPAVGNVQLVDVIHVTPPPPVRDSTPHPVRDSTPPDLQVDSYR